MDAYYDVVNIIMHPLAPHVEVHPSSLLLLVLAGLLGPSS